jgi:hypothetical protein
LHDGSASCSSSSSSSSLLANTPSDPSQEQLLAQVVHGINFTLPFDELRKQFRKSMQGVSSDDDEDDEPTEEHNVTTTTKRPKATASEDTIQLDLKPAFKYFQYVQAISYTILHNERYLQFRDIVTALCTFSLAQLCIGRDRAARWIGQCHSITNSAWPNANTFATSVGSTATQHQNRGVARQEESMYTTRREQPSSANATLWSW